LRRRREVWIQSIIPLTGFGTSEKSPFPIPQDDLSAIEIELTPGFDSSPEALLPAFLPDELRERKGELPKLPGCFQASPVCQWRWWVSW
jgi:hypothetical protein